MLAALLDVLFPPVCRGCGRTLIEGERHLCLHCLAHLPRSFYALDPTDNPMTRRFAGIFPFERAASWLLYSHNSLTASIIQDFKYRMLPQLATEVGRVMADELKMAGYFDGIDGILPMGQHWTRRLRRGYNQTEMLARGVAEVTGIEVLDNLRAAKSHRTQTHVSLDRRRTNPEGVYRISHPEELEHRHILILDDVCTTGATIISAAETLLNSSPTTTLSILTLASTV